MGGNGSGRKPAAEKKAITDNCITLNLLKLAREGSIRYGAAYSGMFTAPGDNQMQFILARDTITLFYHHIRQDREIKEVIKLSLAPCNFGGQRLYMHCPECQARVLKLYFVSEHGRYLCRSCGDLSYESRQDSRHGGIYDLLKQLRANVKEERRYAAAWKKANKQRVIK